MISRAWFYVSGGESSGVFPNSSIIAAGKSALSLSLTESGEHTTALGTAATEIIREL